MATSVKTSSIFTSLKNQKQPKNSSFHEINLSFLDNSSPKNNFLKLSYTKSKHNNKNLNLVTKNALNTNTLDTTSPVSTKPKEPSVVNNGTGLVQKQNRPMILVSEKLGEAGLAVLREYGEVDCIYDLTPEDLCKQITKYDALIVRSGTKVNRAVFEAAKGGLKVVGRAGVGIDNVDLQAATEHGSLVVNAPTANTIAAAEHGIALLTSMARNVAQADASMKAGIWGRSKYVGVSLVGKTLAVMGFGKVGSEVARRAKGLGMHVIAHDPYAPADRARAVGVELVSF
ncbi:D-3-phosphoglycerate dehydrogenase 2, chloroplastic-like, partial [Chenopodium quinoa]|uniref:D-3-phosphoglycerate dehydrogenase 2, chloroplastic-like n=1 Tax=Chenopodium quinoa TaxID=63459 RepID=UPI000B775A50